MRTRTIAILASLAMLAAACGSDSGGPAPTVAAGDTVTTAAGTTQPPPSGDDTGGNQSNQPPASVDGAIVIDGEEFGVSQVIRCEPYVGPGSEANDADLDLVASSTGGQYLSIIVSNGDGYTRTAETFPQQTQEARVNLYGDDGQEQFVSAASHDADDNWFLNFTPTLGDQEGETPLEGPPFSIGGNQISGAMHLIMDYPTEGGGEMDISFELPIPSDITEC